MSVSPAFTLYFPCLQVRSGSGDVNFIITWWQTLQYNRLSSLQLFMFLSTMEYILGLKGPFGIFL